MNVNILGRSDERATLQIFDLHHSHGYVSEERRTQNEKHASRNVTLFLDKP